MAANGASGFISGIIMSTTILGCLLLGVFCTSIEAVKYDIVGSAVDSEGFEVFTSHHVGRQRRQAVSDPTPVVDPMTPSPDPAQGSQVSTSQAAPAGNINLGQPASSPAAAAASPTTTTTTTTTPQPAAPSTPPAPTTQKPAVETSTLSAEEQKEFDEANILHDDHKYYNASYQKPADFSNYWVDLQSATQHNTLSKGHRVAAVIPLNFNFSFYGHDIQKVTVATGGFIYMSPFLHQWLTATQYIAPLMANFDPSLNANSTIYYQNLKTNFTVEWKNMILQDEQSKGSFHFQCTLYHDNTIRFAYKTVPGEVNDISSKKHPVKVGLSDAYYNDTYVPQYEIKRRTIYEYHKVVLNKTRIDDGSVITITPLPTCNRLTSCTACSNHAGVDFQCKWCNYIGRCSDGLDWYRQHWDQNQCRDTYTDDSSTCSDLPKPAKTIVDPHDTSMYDHLNCPDGDCGRKKTSSATVVVVLIIALIVILVGAAGTWVYYAYTHPTSKSGMWLMEHRPSQMAAKIKFWKNNSSSSAKYQTERDTTEA